MNTSNDLLNNSVGRVAAISSGYAIARTFFVLIPALWAAMYVTAAGRPGPQTIEAINVAFADVKEVFMKDKSYHDAIMYAEKTFMPKGLVVDAITRAESGTIWSKRVGGDSYRNPFHERAFEVQSIEALRSVSVDKLVNMFGDPDLMEQAMDYQTTVIWQWRLCNGKQGNEFQGIEVTAGFKPNQRDDVQFLLLRVAHNEKAHQ